MLTPLVGADTIVISFSGGIGNVGANGFYLPTNSYTGQVIYTLPAALAPSTELYSFPATTDGITISIGNYYTFSSVGTGQSIGDVGEINGYQYFNFFSHSFTTNPPVVMPGTEVSLALGPTGSPGLLTSTSLMPTEINFADMNFSDGFPGSNVDIGFGTFQLLGSIDSIQLTDISLPEPSTLNLIALSLLGIVTAIAVRGFRKTPDSL